MTGFTVILGVLHVRGMIEGYVTVLRRKYDLLRSLFSHEQIESHRGRKREKY